jgi:NAD(P)-dependent dehydrogenase (short-subunit alcohol dehydrogenase family)
MNQLTRSKKDKIAIVTGAAAGLGLSFAKRLASEQATVIAVDRDEARELPEKLKALGASDASFIQADVSDEAQIERLAGSVLDRYRYCDIIVNNAGICPHVPFSELTLAEWRRVMAVNVESMFLMSRALVPAMIERHYGRIVNITSAMLGEVISGRCHYMASKSAIIGFTRALANELGAHGVTVNCIAPALTRTPTTERELPDMSIFEMVAQARAIKKHAMPDDLSGALSFLTSDDAAFITGQTLIVDGGLLKAL